MGWRIGAVMREKEKLEIFFGHVDTAIEVMREVACWGREQGYRVWLEEWLTKDELYSEEAKDENFCVGKVGDKVVCSFILQYEDKEYWPNAPKYEAVYLHKFCVRRKFAHQKMTKQVVVALREYCKSRGISYIRLDTGLDEEIVKAIYLEAGFQIVNVIDCGNGRSMVLYELEV